MESLVSSSCLKNKVLIGFVGLYRNFKETSKNIFINLIENNLEKYDFTIIINTDKECINTDKWNNCTSQFKYNNIDELENDLINSYNIHNQLKYIVYYNYNSGIKDTDPFLLRINQIINIEKNKKNLNYDYYIFLRMDIILNRPIIINNYYNKFSIISGHLERPCHFSNRDWDFMWISDKKSFFLWIYLYSIFFKNYYNDNRLLSYKHDLYNTYNNFDNIESKLTNNEINYLYYRSKLKGYYSYGICKAVYNLYLNNCDFELSENIDLYAILLYRK
jgi:hypothetical protein